MLGVLKGPDDAFHVVFEVFNVKDVFIDDFVCKIFFLFSEDFKYDF